MGRTKKFSRDEVLKAAMPVFWNKGFADTSMYDLEVATKVKKSGLYSEFKDKDDLFTESLKFYFQNVPTVKILTAEPLGLKNIENLFRFIVETTGTECKGCFGINSLREVDILPKRANQVLDKAFSGLKKLFTLNLRAHGSKLPINMAADFIFTHFLGFCIETNLTKPEPALIKEVNSIVKILQRL